jgi:glutaredoxin 3
LLESKGIEFTEYQVGKDIDKDKLEEKVGNTVRTVPQIFVDDKYIGGYQELVAYLK